MTPENLYRGKQLNNAIRLLRIDLKILKENDTVLCDLKNVPEKSEEHQKLRSMLVEVYESLLTKAEKEFGEL